MNRIRPFIRQAALFALLTGHAVAERDPAAASLSGRWDAVVGANEVEVPFPFEIEVSEGSVRGSFFNGERRTTSTAGRIEGATLTLAFDQYATKLVATLKDGELAGEYRRPKGSYPFRATRAASAATGLADPGAPSIDGVWVVTAKSTKGETAWRFIARQEGAQVNATILRVDGDTGTLSGSYRDGRFVLSHFSGARPQLLEVTPRADGTLRLKQNGRTDLFAARENTTQAANLDAFPTTFILGRDGRGRRVHAGFPGPGSGAFQAEAEEKLTSVVEALLAEEF